MGRISQATLLEVSTLGLGSSRFQQQRVAALKVQYALLVVQYNFRKQNTQQLESEVKSKNI